MAVPSQPLEGFYYDELSKIRVIEPETGGQTQELKEECKEFVDSELTAMMFLIKAHHHELGIRYVLNLETGLMTLKIQIQE